MQKASTDKAKAREVKERQRSERERRGMCSSMVAKAKRRPKQAHDNNYELFINRFIEVGKFLNWKWLNIVEQKYGSVRGLKK